MGGNLTRISIWFTLYHMREWFLPCTFDLSASPFQSNDHPSQSIYRFHGSAECFHVTMCEFCTLHSGGVLHAFSYFPRYYSFASICNGKLVDMVCNGNLPCPQICWYLAAVVQVQLCKYFIEIGDSERESTVWGEINVLRSGHSISPFLCYLIPR